jgi:hypothetical protein
MANQIGTKDFLRWWEVFFILEERAKTFPYKTRF